MATTKSKKSKSKFKRLIHSFDPTSKKGMMLLFLISFVIVGGGYAAFKTFAASYPKSSMRQPILKYSQKAADGYVGDMLCISVAGSTAYGSLSQCVQYNSSKTQARPGLYSLSSRIFNQSGVWLPTHGTFKGGVTSDGMAAVKCANMDNYFLGTQTVTGYGTAQFGHVYRYAQVSATTWKWQVKWATMNVTNKSCSVSGSWMSAVSWDNIQTN